jgi:hypothetical protein
MVLVFFSCKKDSFITSPDATISTSADTLSFDTVFVTTGSITRQFKIINTNSRKLRIARVALSGGSASPFKINVDGTPGPEADDVEINGHDSIYVFVQVTVDPSGSALPFILEDSIGIEYNGNRRFVQLRAYGQNAVFLKNATLTGDVTWNNSLPYVIIGGVQVAPGATLHISPGTKIYLHADAPFLVGGTLEASGTRDQPVVFSGDRLDEDYRDLPAAWPGIYFQSGSGNSSLKHAIIRNAYQGIIAQDLPATAGPKVNLSQCILDNIYDAGILGINTSVYADNCLISNCGSNLEFLLGGDYRFTNCTVASYNTIYVSHKTPVLQLSDSYTQNDVVYTASLNAFFQNCIFWGDGGTVDDEILITKEGSDAFSASFDHVLYKAKNDLPLGGFSASVKNMPPLFDSIDISRNIFDFHCTLDAASPVVNAGTLTSFPNDLDDRPRDALPDIGCYEK